MRKFARFYKHVISGAFCKVKIVPICVGLSSERVAPVVVFWIFGAVPARGPIDLLRVECTSLRSPLTRKTRVNLQMGEDPCTSESPFFPSLNAVAYPFVHECHDLKQSLFHTFHMAFQSRDVLDSLSF